MSIFSDLDDPSLCVIHDKYLTCLRTFTKKHFPSQPNRVEELLVRLPEVRFRIVHRSFIKRKKLILQHYILFLNIWQTFCNILSFRWKKPPLFCWNQKCFTCHFYWILRLDNNILNTFVAVDSKEENKRISISNSEQLWWQKKHYILPPNLFKISFVKQFKLKEWQNASFVNVIWDIL